MTDGECVNFLRWALPHMRLRWEGYRNVRGQVCKRVTRRMRDLGIADARTYSDYLSAHSEEWETLRTLCRVTISRFYRDRGVFHLLETEVLPRLAQHANRDRRGICIWCAGCAGGEEAYTLSLVWHLRVSPGMDRTPIHVLATDIDSEELERAREGVFPAGALRELPRDLLEAGFEKAQNLLRIRDGFRVGLEFCWGDLTQDAPRGPFDLVLCRNLAFTYFDEQLQTETAARITTRLHRGGVLVVGKHEKVPATRALVPISRQGLYAYVPDGEARLEWLSAQAT